MTTDRTIRASQVPHLADSPSPAKVAALQGASLAFGKPPVKPKPDFNTYTGSDGALAAARGVGGSKQAPGQLQRYRINGPVTSNNTGDQFRIRRDNTGGGIGVLASKAGSQKRSPSRSRMGRLEGNGFLQPSSTPAAEGKSPSFIAATLAASRSASISPNITGQNSRGLELTPQFGFTQSPSSKGSSSKESLDNPLDTSSIPPTASLIGMFERNAEILQDERQLPPKKNTRAPKPVMQQDQSTKRPQTPSRRPDQSRPSIRSSRSPSPNLIAPIPVKPELSQPIRSMTSGDVPQLKPKPKSKPRAADPQKSSPVANSKTIKSSPPDHGDVIAKDSFPSGTDRKPPIPPPRKHASPRQRQRMNSASSLSLDPTASASKINSMANAIVASSLASSRAASPSKNLQPPPPPASRRSPRGLEHIFHNHKEVSRTPSPSKQSTLRTTMRKPRTEPEVDEGDKRRTKKHNIMKKHPNKHHEGDRKRWRDEITERERKRYEAVWASNKGLYVPSTVPDGEYCVCSLVVKDIFSRSRLHVDVLEEVYTLVDRKGNGTLEKEEFVVGLWLIDQRLKGRKLPIRVSDHVWRSVGALQGIKVRKAH